MFYTNNNKSFKQHVHPNLQRRIRMFFGLGGVMLAVVLYDLTQGLISVPWALGSIVVGAVVGLITSRILKLTWSHDGNMVVSRIDTVGYIVLVSYLAFEVARATFISAVVHTGSDATAITFAFVSSALISRVFGLRGKIVQILKEEKVFG